MKRPFLLSGSRSGFRMIPVNEIVRNPYQPRCLFDKDELDALTDSISRYGVITPLSVRKTKEGYELVAGERRLRASKQAGLREVPCYVINAGEQESAEMALIENIQRKDLDFFEEAKGIKTLIDTYGLTQQQIAERVGRSQPAVANKLRLLRLPPEAIEKIRDNQLSERHARVLLQLADEKEQLDALDSVIRGRMNVEQTERYIEKLLKQRSEKQRRKFIVKDIRIFINTLSKAVRTMKGSGVNASVKKEQCGDDTVITIRIPAVSTK